jgi:hypothetical protein
MSDMPGLEPAVVTAIEDYLRSLQAHASAEQMLAAGLRSFAAKDGPNGQLPAVSGGSAQRAPSRFPTCVRKSVDHFQGGVYHTFASFGAARNPAAF